MPDARRARRLRRRARPDTIAAERRRVHGRRRARPGPGGGPRRGTCRSRGQRRRRAAGLRPLHPAHRPRGRLVLPGFIDSHAHASETVGDVFGARLKGLGSLEEYVGGGARFCRRPPRAARRARLGLEQRRRPGTGPTATELDAAVADRPALLVSEDGHSLWANSLALRLAGVGPDTPDPANGVIEREPGDGRPTGTLREGAQHLVLTAVAPFTREQYAEGIRHFQRTVAGPLGITSVFDPHARRRRTGLRCLRGPAARRRAHRALSRRLLAALRRCPWTNSCERRRQSAPGTPGSCSRPTPSSSSPTASSRATRPSSTSPTRTLPATAAFPNGRPRISPRLRSRRRGEGFELHYHAIGDAGTAMALDAIAAVRAAGLDGGRPGDHARPAHVATGDVERFAEARRDRRPQPLLVPQGRLLLRPPGALPRPAASRARVPDGELLCGRRARGLGQRLPGDGAARPPGRHPGGRDALVRRRGRSRRRALARGASRRRADDRQLHDRRRPRPAVIERETGSLEAGKSADLVVLDTQRPGRPPDEIGAAKVLLTLSRGQEVFRHPSL